MKKKHTHTYVSQANRFKHITYTIRLEPKTGCTAWVTNRIPDPLKAQMRANQSLEFYWATHDDDDESSEGRRGEGEEEEEDMGVGVGGGGRGEAGGVLTHVLDTHYESPAGAFLCLCLSGRGRRSLEDRMTDMMTDRVHTHTHSCSHTHKHQPPTPDRLRLGAPRAGREGHPRDT
jgi:hypothetical protein